MKARTEEHFHIQELIKAQSKRTEDRNDSRNKLKESEERNDLIKDSKTVTLTDFWCTDCQKDFKGQAVKQVEIDWSNTKQSIAFYKTKCFCGKWAIRLITDKFKDGYWTQSRMLSAQRGIFHNDVIQPHETGYNMLYGRKNKN